MEVNEEHGMLALSIGGGKHVLVYPKDDHVPATYTCSISRSTISMRPSMSSSGQAFSSSDTT